MRGQSRPLSPVVSESVATEPDLGSDPALAPACCRISGKCSVYFMFLEPQLSYLENGNTPDSKPCLSEREVVEWEELALVGAQGGGRRKRECAVWGVGAEAALELGAVLWVWGLLLTAGSVALGPLLPCRPGTGHSTGELRGVLGQMHS